MALFSVSAITELVAEPLWVMGQRLHYVRLRYGSPSPYDVIEAPLCQAEGKGCTVAPPPYDIIEAPLCQAEGKGGMVAPPPMMS